MSLPDRTGSADSTYNLRHNPLNIRNSDGSDFTVPKKRFSVPELASTSSTDLLIHSLMRQEDDDDQLPPSMRIGRQKQKISPKSISQKEIDDFHKMMSSSREERQNETYEHIEHRRADHYEGFDGLAPPSGISSLDTSNRSLGIEQELEDTLKALEGSGDKDEFPELKFDYENREQPDPVRELTIPSKTERESLKTDLFQLDFNLESHDDLGRSLLDEFEQLNVTTGLGRKNTITSKGKIQTGPSRTAPVIQARKFVKPKISRSEESDVASNLSISTPMLDAISFTPASLSTDSARSESLSSVPESQTSVETAVESAEDVEKSEKAEEYSVYEETDGIESPEEDFSWMPQQTEQIDQTDRGRLFLRIDGLQDIALPMDHTRDPHFTMCLDNGIQSVRTYPIKFPSDSNAQQASIGQEFELLVGRRLDLVLTLSGQMDPLPKLKAAEPEISKSVPSSPKKTETSPKKKRFSLFGSPKKKKEEKRPKSPEKQKKQVEAAPKVQQEPPKDVWKHLIGTNGEFARAYIEESAFEESIFGKPHTFLIPCLNEWTLHKVADRDEKSGVVRGMHLAKKPPYKIANLRVTMMYIPKLNNAEELPSSMRECLEELQKAYQFQAPKLKGSLTQKGMDCHYYRRRWFTLSEGILRGHTEDGRKVRAEWRLQDVLEVIDMNKVTEDDDPCINPERAFRLLFKNGDKINFYSDTVEEKMQWVKDLKTSTVFSTGKPLRWTDLVIKREKEEKKGGEMDKNGREFEKIERKFEKKEFRFPEVV